MPTYKLDIGPLEDAYTWDTSDMDEITYSDGTSDPATGSFYGLRTTARISALGIDIGGVDGDDPLVFANDVGIKWKTSGGNNRTMLKLNGTNTFIIGNDDATDGADKIRFDLENITEMMALTSLGLEIADGYMSADYFVSTIATGTAPMTVNSTTKVANLNAELLDGTDWRAPGPIGAVTPGSGAFTTISASGQITSTVSSGTAPFVVASNTVIANLNASLLLGNTWAAPAAIGSSTPAAGTFSTLVGRSASGGVHGVHRQTSSPGAGNTFTFWLNNTSGTMKEASRLFSSWTSNTLGSEQGILAVHCTVLGSISTEIGRFNASGLTLVSGMTYQINNTQIGLSNGLAGVMVTTPAAAHMLLYDDTDSRFENVPMSGDVTITKAGVTTLKNTGTPGVYTAVTTDAQGRVVSGASSKRTIYLPAALFKPTGVGGVASVSSTQSMGTSLRSYDCIAFVDSSSTAAYVGFVLPDDFDNANPEVDIRLIWFRTNLLSGGTVRWIVGAVATADAENMDGGATSPTTTVMEVDDNGAFTLVISEEAGVNAIAGTPAANEHVYLQLTRDGAHANDDHAATVQFVGIELSYVPKAA